MRNNPIKLMHVQRGSQFTMIIKRSDLQNAINVMKKKDGSSVALNIQ